MWQWRITEFEGGRLLPDALVLRIPAAPRAYLRQLVRKGKVRGNGRPLADEATVAGGMHLTIPASARLAELITASGIPPWSLLYEDQAAMVIFKPAGLAVHQAAGHDDNLTSRVTRFLALRHVPYRAAPVHRLDIGTSGPVLFGKGREATSQYGRLLMAGQLGRVIWRWFPATSPPRASCPPRFPKGIF
jgi:23S rRNA-/tRNA-specific pseudouridylate synthase